MLIEFSSLSCVLNTQAIHGDSTNTNIPIDSIKGVITLGTNFNIADTISIYNIDGSLWYRFSFEYDDSDGIYDFYNKEFNPFAFNPDYYTLALKVVSMEIPEVCNVIVNEDSGLQKIIKLNSSSGLEFKNFEEYILSSSSISFDPEVNELLDDIEGSPLVLLAINNITVIPLKIRKDWMEVRVRNNNSNTDQVGWIKWKMDGKMLISLHSD